MNIENITAFAIAIGLGGLLKTLLDWILKTATDRRNQKKANNFTRVLNAIKAVNFQIRTILRESNAVRVVVLKTTNGGGKPTLTGRLYSSVIYEDYKAPLKPIKEDWQNQLLDPQYLDALTKLTSNKNIKLDTKYMPDSMLKNVYLANGVVTSLLFELTERETEYIYISVNFNEPVELSPALNNLFRSSVSRLAYLFSKNANI